MNQAFTDSDRLHLLQLLTRRAMAERNNRAEEQEGLGIGIDDHHGTEPAAIDETRARHFRTTDAFPLIVLRLCSPNQSGPCRAGDDVNSEDRPPTPGEEQ